MRERAVGQESGACSHAAGLLLTWIAASVDCHSHGRSCKAHAHQAHQAAGAIHADMVGSQRAEDSQVEEQGHRACMTKMESSQCLHAAIGGDCEGALEFHLSWTRHQVVETEESQLTQEHLLNDLGHALEPSWQVLVHD